MAVQYNSLIDPLVIMLTVPLALAGGILGLFVTGTAIGATVIVGAVLLVGIVVNNAIIMVELANQIYQATGCSRESAILQAAPRRLRPILMTTLTTVFGIIPPGPGHWRWGRVFTAFGHCGLLWAIRCDSVNAVYYSLLLHPAASARSIPASPFSSPVSHSRGRRVL